MQNYLHNSRRTNSVVKIVKRMDARMQRMVGLTQNLVELTQTPNTAQERAAVWAILSQTNDRLHMPDPPAPPSKRRARDSSPRWYGKQFYRTVAQACVFELANTHTLAHLIVLENTLIQCLAFPLQ